MLRAVVGALAITVFLSATAAFARSREQLFFRVQLANGKVQRLSQSLEPQGEVPWPPAVADKDRSIATRDGTLLILERDRAHAGTNKITWKHTVETGKGWFPWQVLQQNVVTYLWREEIPGESGRYRELIRAVDIATRQVLWSRHGTLNSSTGAGAVGPSHLLLDQSTEVLLLETRTGKELRSFRKSAPQFAVSRPIPGRIWLEAGERIDCLDEATTSTIWSLSTQGALLWLLPIPKSDDWLIKTSSHAYRVRPTDGARAWSAETAGSSRPLLTDDRSYEVLLEGRDWPYLILVARDLQNGHVLRRYTVDRYKNFFDEARVSAAAARNGSVDVAAEFRVLE